MNRAKRKKEFRELWREAAMAVYGDTGLPHPPLDDRRYQIMQWQGVWRDEESGEHFTFLVTGDTNYYLVYQMFGDSTIAAGEGVPVRKTDLPRKVRRALAAGWSNTHLKSAVGECPTASGRAVLSFGEDGRPIDAQWVLRAIAEAVALVPLPAYLIFIADEFDHVASEMITLFGRARGVALLKARKDHDGFVFVG